VFGTDYTYPRDAISIAGLRQLEQTAELDDGERRGVPGASPARLIPRLVGVSDLLSDLRIWRLASRARRSLGSGDDASLPARLASPASMKS
jgi:hypothetical protein